MPRYSCPIVGMYHHPPAQGILNVAPNNSSLVLRPQPDNQYDSNAIMVWFETISISKDNWPKLEAAISGYGIGLNDFLLEPEWHLGYLPRGVAAIITLDSETPGSLEFDPHGKPMVVFQYQGEIK